MPQAQAAPERAQIRSKPQRAVPSEAGDILAAGVVAHVAFAVDGQPYVIPMTYHFDAAEPDRIHIHGAHHGRLMRHLATGAAVCVSVTLVDGLVYSRSAKYHSVNYRSVVAFARAMPEAVLDERRGLLEAMIERMFPGRKAGVHYEPTPDEHVAATAFVTLRIEEMSAKARRGGPMGPRDADADSPYTCGVVPLREG